MATFRVQKNGNYTTMSNFHFKDKRLSLKAKGLLSQMLSLPDTWDYTLRGLAVINKESIDAIRTAVLELEKNGYLTRKQSRQEDGKMGPIEYFIYETPQDKPPGLENPIPVKPTPGYTASENPTQLRTNELKTYALSTNPSTPNQSINLF